MTIKTYNASPAFGAALTKQEIDDFLRNSKLNLQLGTINSNGDPMIHPVWYYFMDDKMYIETTKTSVKAGNLKQRNVMYFCVDDEKLPYKGVKGKGTAKIIEDINKTVPIAEKIMIKYTGSLDTPIARTLMSAVKAGSSVIIEVTPKYYSTWDYSKHG